MSAAPARLPGDRAYSVQSIFASANNSKKKSVASVSENLQTILDQYRGARNGEGGQFGRAHPVYQAFMDLQQALSARLPVSVRSQIKVKAGPGRGNWGRVPWIALLHERETTSTQRGVYVVFLFREDMSGVYLTFNQGVTEVNRLHGTLEARNVLQERARRLHTLLPEGNHQSFQPGYEIDLRTSGQLGSDYEKSTAACKFYESGRIPSDEEMDADLEIVLAAYDTYLDSDLRREFSNYRLETEVQPSHEELTNAGRGDSIVPELDFDLSAALADLLVYIKREGFVFEPWHVAQYVTALRTKPFVILAGITGTGKSKLPQLVERGTGGEADLLPVRPDWTDSSEVLGYVDLQGVFRPGRVLQVAHLTAAEDDVHRTLIIDEMNLARVEHYFAEVLSRIEDRRPHSRGGWTTSPLVQMSLRGEDAEWGAVGMPSNLALVGTVNMDESAHGFSRKVLDRAFTLELSDIAFESWSPATTAHEDNRAPVQMWPVRAWWPRATRLSELQDLTTTEATRIDGAIRELSVLNRILSIAQLQIGYRTRDEVALFLLHSEDVRTHFRTEGGEAVDPMDLAVQMKILPRIAGGSDAIRRVLLGILGWAFSGSPLIDDEEARDVVEQWESAERPGRLLNARYPAVAARTCLMWERFRAEGFTSFWL